MSLYDFTLESICYWGLLGFKEIFLLSHLLYCPFSFRRLGGTLGGTLVTAGLSGDPRGPCAPPPLPVSPSWEGWQIYFSSFLLYPVCSVFLLLLINVRIENQRGYPSEELFLKSDKLIPSDMPGGRQDIFCFVLQNSAIRRAKVPFLVKILLTNFIHFRTRVHTHTHTHPSACSRETIPQGRYFWTTGKNSCAKVCFLPTPGTWQKVLGSEMGSGLRTPQGGPCFKHRTWTSLPSFVP